MRRGTHGKLFWLAVVGLAMAAVPAVVAASPEPSDEAESQDSAAPRTNQRVGGDMEITVEKRDFSYFAGDASITTPLPEGYPAPTPPGAIEIKHYPSVRRAQITLEGGEGTARRQNSGFWPLFRHIEANGIAMTAPVEMDYTGMGPDGEGDLESWTMAFLYRTRDLHPTGTDASDDRVVIVDSEPVTVLSVGYTGDSTMLRVRAEVFRLNKWIEGQDEWEIVGDPRSFGYNGPSVSRNRRWGEVQIPIRKVQQPDTVDDTVDGAKEVDREERDKTL